MSASALTETTPETAPTTDNDANSRAKEFLNPAPSKIAPSNPTSLKTKATRLKKGFDRTHSTYAGVSGLAANAAGIGLGLLVGMATEPDCKDESAFVGCGNQCGHSPNLAGIGYLLAAPLGVYLYVQNPGFEGSYWISLLGHLGAVALIGVAVAQVAPNGAGSVASVGQKVLVYSVPLLGLTGSLWTYPWSLPEGTASTSPSSMNPTFGTPSFAYSDEAGDRRFMLRFVGGHF